MKKLVTLIIIFVIATTTIFTIAKPVEAISVIIEDTEMFLEEQNMKMEEEYNQWHEKYFGKTIFLQHAIHIIGLIIVLNIIIFSVLINKTKNEKIDLIYKIIQIIFLVLIFILYKIKTIIPEKPGCCISEMELWVKFILNYSIIQAFNSFITIFINKRKYLFYSSILFIAVYTIYYSSIRFYSSNFWISGIICMIIITNFLFLPLYLKKNKLKEEENVRI